MENNVCGIYKITNPLNGYFYIGKAHSIGKRWKQHRYDMENGKHTRAAMSWDYEMAAENGEDFIFEVVEECSVNSLSEREDYWIDKLKPEYNFSSMRVCDPDSGYSRWFFAKLWECREKFIKRLRMLGYSKEFICVYDFSEFIGKNEEYLTEGDIEFLSRYTRGKKSYIGEDIVIIQYACFIVVYFEAISEGARCKFYINNDLDPKIVENLFFEEVYHFHYGKSGKETG